MIKVDRKKVGRPALSEKGSMSVFIRLPKDVYTDMMKRAKERGMKKSGYIRELIKEDLRGKEK